jgi:hypothetical protein
MSADVSEVRAASIIRAMLEDSELQRIFSYDYKYEAKRSNERVKKP